MRNQHSILIAGWLFILMAIWGCKTGPTIQTSTIEGQTMGTTYHIIYVDSLGQSVKPEVDSILAALNQEVSTWDKTSVISRFNQTKDKAVVVDRKHHYFWDNLEKAQDIYLLSEGFFDPTVMPLVNYWGFGYTGKKKREIVDSIQVDSIRQFVGMDKLFFRKESDTIYKAHPNIELDFSAIAKGYGVDVVAEYLESIHIFNYMVEIGGENRASGAKPNGNTWSIGINVPEEEALVTDFDTIIQLVNQAMATSGNYRNFYEVNGQKYSHTINPKTGYVERNDLLSVSVFAPDCTSADALATAMMTMGHQQAVDLLKRMSGIDAYFITTPTEKPPTQNQPSKAHD